MQKTLIVSGRTSTSPIPSSVGSGPASPDKDGYGTIKINGKMKKAHRMSWAIHHGPPGKLHVLHHCDVTACVNPNPGHLFLGTHQDNMRDRDQKHRGNNARGEQNGLSKLTVEQVREIRALAASGMGGTEIAKRYPVNAGTIGKVIRREMWKHVK